jgi:excisionase family DNA binding protein
MLRFRQVAERLGCSISNVYSLKEQGLIAVVSTGAGGKGYRVAEEELDRFIRERREHRGKDAPPIEKKTNPAGKGQPFKNFDAPPIEKKTNPTGKGQPFKNFDGEKLLQAWRRRGVLGTD